MKSSSLSDLPCSPCGKPTCRYKTMECMESIEVPEVLEAIRLVMG